MIGEGEYGEFLVPEICVGMSVCKVAMRDVVGVMRPESMAGRSEEDVATRGLSVSTTTRFPTSRQPCNRS